MKRMSWLDALRGIAIIAVVLDHAFFLFPQFRNDILWWHTYFSVPWFVFLAGITNGMAARKRVWKFPQSFLQYWFRRCSLLFWYIGISFVIFWFDTGVFANRSLFFDRLLNFSIEPTYYFINLILQLYLIFPLLASFVIILKNRWLRLGLIVLSFAFAELVLARIPAPWPFSPPGSLFGGLYFPVFAAGVVFAFEDLFFKKVMLIAAAVLFLWFEFELAYTNGSFISIVQNIPLLSWSLSSLLLVGRFMQGFEKAKVMNVLIFLGKQSLPIYLAHFFVLRHLSAWPRTWVDFITLVSIALITGAMIQPAIHVVARAFGAWPHRFRQP